MSSAAKVASCTYCGTRVVFSLAGDSRHDLICNSCGAPLKNTKLIQKNTAPAAAAQTLLDPSKKDQHKDQKRDKDSKERRYKNRRDSEEYKKDRKYKSRNSEDRKWSKEDDDLRRKYKEKKDRDKKYHQQKKPGKKRRGLFYWIREAADEIDDIFD